MKSGVRLVTVKFTVFGQPIGKGRPKFSTVCGHVNAYTPEKTANYETLVKYAYQSQCRGIRFEPKVPLDVRIAAYFKIPSSASKKRAKLMREHIIRPVVKPDVDNVAKVVLDSINGVAFYDDSQIADMQVRKFYDDSPRVVVTIRDIPLTVPHNYQSETERGKPEMKRRKT